MNSVDLIVLVSLLSLFIFIVFACKSCCDEVDRHEAAERAAYESFAARVGSRINPDRVSHLYYRLSPAGRDFIQNAKDFEETERGLASRVVKWRQ
jgi:hypothetical protein